MPMLHDPSKKRHLLILDTINSIRKFFSLKTTTCYILCLFIVMFTQSTNASSTCLYIASYHQGYEWNDGIARGVDNVLAGKCKVDKYFMDTKRNKGEAYYKKSALEARAYIEKTKPDIVIVSDDNASKYLVMPFYKDAALPFVFCGINWTVEPYGYPYKNATGMIEVAPIRPLLKEINNVLTSTSSGIYLSADVLTEHKDYERYRKIYEREGITLKGVFVKSMAEWKKEFIAAQSTNIDFIILNNNSGINDWSEQQGRDTAQEYSTVFSVTNYDWMMPYTMFAMTKLPEEQGEWAAAVALDILDGATPDSIPIVANRRWNIFVNTQLLDKADIKLPPHLIHKAIKTGM